MYIFYTAYSMLKYDYHRFYHYISIIIPVLKTSCLA